jgi:hypothetical protein
MSKSMTRRAVLAAAAPALPGCGCCESRRAGVEWVPKRYWGLTSAPLAKPPRRRLPRRCTRRAGFSFAGRHPFPVEACWTASASASDRQPNQHFTHRAKPRMRAMACARAGSLANGSRARFC